MEVLIALVAMEAAEAVMVQVMETTTVIRQMAKDHKAAAEATVAMEAVVEVVAAAVMVQVVMVMVMVEIARMVALMVPILI